MMTARVTRIFLKRNKKRGIRPVFYCHVLSSLLLRSSTINVKNVGVQLWQSSAICLRAFARSAFLLLAMTMGSNGIFLNALTTPTLRVTPPMEGNLVHTVVEQSSPLRRGGALCATGWSLRPRAHARSLSSLYTLIKNGAMPRFLFHTVVVY